MTELYKPSNATEFVEFDEEWCSRCRRDYDCAILARATKGESVWQWIETPQGPTCKAFEDGEKAT